MPWRWWPQVRRTSKWSRVLYKMKMQMQWQRHWWAQLLIDWNIWVWLETVFWRYVWHCFTLFWTFGITACFFHPQSRKDERRCWSLWDEKMLKWRKLEVVAARLQWHRDSCPLQSDGAATAAEDPIVDLEWFRYIQIDLDGQSDGLLPSCDTTSLWNHVVVSINGGTVKWMVYNGKSY